MKILRLRCDAPSRRSGVRRMKIDERDGGWTCSFVCLFTIFFSGSVWMMSWRETQNGVFSFSAGGFPGVRRQSRRTMYRTPFVPHPSQIIIID